MKILVVTTVYFNFANGTQVAVTVGNGTDSGGPGGYPGADRNDNCGSHVDHVNQLVVRYRWISARKAEGYGVAQACRAMQVSSSGHYE